MAKGCGKIMTSVPDTLKGGKGKTLGGEGVGNRSFPGEDASNKNDKHEGLKPITRKTIMTEKGLVVRDEAARTHVYAAASTQDQTQRQLVTDLLERAFDGSAAKLVLQALAASKASPEELAEIRKLLRGSK